MLYEVITLKLTFQRIKRKWSAVSRKHSSDPRINHQFFICFPYHLLFKNNTQTPLFPNLKAHKKIFTWAKRKFIFQLGLDNNSIDSFDVKLSEIEPHMVQKFMAAMFEVILIY